MHSNEVLGQSPHLEHDDSCLDSTGVWENTDLLPCVPHPPVALLRSRLRCGFSSALVSLFVRLLRGFSAAFSASAAGSWSDFHEQGFLPDLGVLPDPGVLTWGLCCPNSGAC